MRTRYFIIIGMVCTLAAGAMAGELQNGGFETTVGKLPANWSCNVLEGDEVDTISVDSNVKRSGENALRITHTKPNSFSAAVQTIPVKKNTDYLISGYAKCEGLEGAGGGARIFVFAANKALADLPATNSRWQKLTARFNSGNNESIIVDCYLHRMKGSVVFDDIVLIPCDKPEEYIKLLDRSTEWKFKENDEFLGWTLQSYKKSSVENGVLRGTTACVLGVTSPFLISPNLYLDAGKFNTLQMKIKSSKSGSGKIYFREVGGRFDENKTAPLSIVGDNQWHTYNVELGNHKLWRNYIEQLQICLLYQDDVEIEISEIQFLATEQKAARGLFYNRGFEEKGGDGKIPGWEFVSSGITPKAVAFDNGMVLSLAGTGRIVLTPKDVYLDFLEPEDDFTLAFSVKSNRTLEFQAELLQYDSFEKLIAKKKIGYNIKSSSEWQIFDASGITLLPSTMKVAFCFTILSNVEEVTLLDNFYFGKKELKNKMEISSWKGEWIQPVGKAFIPDEMFFRKSFELKENPVFGQLGITADNKLRAIYVNGQKLELGRYAGDYQSVDVMDISKQLKKGLNVLAVDAKNNDGPGGLLAEAAIELADGSKAVIHSDRTFRVATKSVPGWEQPDFNDTGWPLAWSHGKPEDSLWGAIKHPNLDRLKAVEIKDYTAADTVTPGEKTTVRFNLKPEVESFACALKLELPSGAFTLWRNHFTNLKSGDSFAVAAEVNIPDFIKSGNACKIILTSDDVRIEGKHAKLVKIVNNESIKSKSTASVLIKDQTPMLMLNDKPFEITHHWTGTTGRITEERLGNCRENNLHLYWGAMVSGWGWREDGNFDFRALDEFCLKLLEIDPDAQILLMLGVDSFHNPEMRSWEAIYPEELVADEKGNTKFTMHFRPNSSAPSWASKIWLEDQKNNMRKIIRHIKDSSYASRIIGYMPVSGMGFEWVYWGGHDGGGGPGKIFLDYSKPFKTGFHEYLQKKYGTIDKLNSAYNSKSADFNQVALPGVVEREKDDYYSFIDPAKNMRLIDFRAYISRLTADVILALGEVVKAETDNSKLFGTFYGYTHNTANSGWCESGHFDLGRVLNSDKVDFLTHLIRYDNRMAGQESGFMAPESSFLLHKKTAIAQLDVRTHRAPADGADGAYSRCKNLQESLAVVKRDFSNCLISGVGFEYGYFGNAWDTGDRRIMEVIGRCRDIEKEMQDKGCLKMDGQSSIAVITDDISTYYTIQKSELHQQLVNSQLPKLNHTGTGVDTFLLQDLPLMPEYKCYLFLNVFNITEVQEKFINEKLKRDNKTLVWVYAPGIIDRDKLNPERIAKIVGIDLEFVDQAVTPQVAFNNYQHPLTKDLKKGATYSSSGKIGPFFVPLNGTTLGIHPESGRPALAVREFGNWTSIYSAFPGLNAEFLQAIAKYAKVHVANPNTLDSTYYSDKLLAVHTATGGARTLYAPGKYRNQATELFTGRKYSIDKNGAFNVELKDIDTYLFLLE